MEYKPAVYNIGRDVVMCLKRGQANRDHTMIVLEAQAIVVLIV